MPTSASVNFADWIAAAAACVSALLLVAQIRHSARVSATDTTRRFIEETRECWDNCKIAAGMDPFDVDKFRNELGKFIAQLELNAATLAEIQLPDRLHMLIDRTIISFVNEMIAALYDRYLLEIFSIENMCRV